MFLSEVKNRLEELNYEISAEDLKELIEEYEEKEHYSEPDISKRIIVSLRAKDYDPEISKSHDLINNTYVTCDRIIIYKEGNPNDITMTIIEGKLYLLKIGHSSNPGENHFNYIPPDPIPMSFCNDNDIIKIIDDLFDTLDKKYYLQYQDIEKIIGEIS